MPIEFFPIHGLALINLLSKERGVSFLTERGQKMEKKEPMTWKEWISILIVCHVVGLIVIVVMATIAGFI